jgi:hypothetical protein
MSESISVPAQIIKSTSEIIQTMIDKELIKDSVEFSQILKDIEAAIKAISKSFDNK